MGVAAAEAVVAEAVVAEAVAAGEVEVAEGTEADHGLGARVPCTWRTAGARCASLWAVRGDRSFGFDPCPGSMGVEGPAASTTTS